MNNLHQLQLAWLLYSGDFNESIAPTGGVNDTAKSITDLVIVKGNWVHGVMGTQYGTPVSKTESLYLRWRLANGRDGTIGIRVNPRSNIHLNRRSCQMTLTKWRVGRL